MVGTDKAEVESCFWKAVGGLRAAGLTVHEIEVDEASTQLLGWELNKAAELRPTHRRLWRVRLAVREVCKRGRASGQQLERLIGHITFISLCRRESLSCLGEVYTFIQRHYGTVVPLWKSVRSELLKWDGLAPLIYSQLTLPWSRQVYAVDASEWGLGVVQSQMSTSEVQELGSQVERWRFKDEAAKDPRLFVQVEDERTGFGHQLQLDSTDGAMPRSFKSVGFSAVDRSWQVVGRHAWRRPDSMPVYEARATLHALRHHVRSVEQFSQQLVILTDSLVAAVSFDRGRASSFKLRRVLQQVACLTLGTRVRVRAASPESGQVVQQVCCPPTPIGGGDPIKDLAVGRDAVTGLAPSGILGANHGAASGLAESGEGLPHVHSQFGRGHRLCGGAMEGVGVQEHGPASHVPSPARRGLFRCRGGTPHLGTDSDPRPVVDIEVSQKLRERQSVAAVIRRPPQKCPEKRCGRQKEHRQNICGPALGLRHHNSVPASLKESVFIEIFSGTGRLGRTVSRCCGWPVLLWDIEYGEQYDLTKRCNQQKIFNWVHSGVIRAGHLCTPCNSFSRARDQPGGPPPLRSDKHVLGLSNLRPHDQLKVRVGNSLMYFSCRLLHKCRVLRIPFTLENPQRSRLWLCPSVKRLFKCPQVAFVDVTFCACGTRWKKPTRFLTVCLDLSHLMQYQCRGSKRGVCAHSGMSHLPLCGLHPSGVFMTKYAEPYPWKLTRLLAQAFGAVELATIADNFSRHL